MAAERRHGRGNVYSAGHLSREGVPESELARIRLHGNWASPANWGCKGQLISALSSRVLIDIARVGSKVKLGSPLALTLQRANLMAPQVGLELTTHWLTTEW